MLNIGFIGAGNMGYAIMKSIKEKSGLEAEIFVYDCYAPAAERAAELGAKTCADAAGVAKNAKYVFLAVKPQQLDQFCEKAFQRAGRKAVARGEIRLEECVICLIQKTVAVYGK